MPYFQRPNMVVSALRSIENIDYDDFEVCIIDDSSETPIEQVIEKHGFKIKNLRILNTNDTLEDKLRRGSTHSGMMNEAIKLSTADIAFYISDDDAIRKDYFKELNKFYLTNPDCMYSYSHVIGFCPFTQVPCETLGIYNKGRNFNTIHPHHLNFTHTLYPTGKVDATQVSWRILSNKEHNIWFPPNQTRCADAALFEQLYKKWGDCRFNGLTGAYKAFHGAHLRGGQLSNRRGPDEFKPNDITSTPKYFSICMNFKDEAIYLKDWIDYHISIGVDHFYLYNNDSTDNYLEVLKPYQDAGLVTLNHISGKFPKKRATENFIKKYKFETFWVALIDSDELLTLTEEGANVRDLFKNYEDFPGVGLNTLYFGSSGLSGIQTPVQEKFTMCSAPHDVAHLAPDPSFVARECRHIKSVVNPRKVKETWVNPHFCHYNPKYLIKNSLQPVAVNTDKKPITLSNPDSFTNTLAETSIENTRHNKAFIRHYYLNTKEEWLRRKLRSCDDRDALFFESEASALEKFDRYEKVKGLSTVRYEDVLRELRKLKDK